MKKSIVNKLGIADLCEDLVIDYDLNHTACFEVTGIDLYLKEYEFQLTYLDRMESFLNTLPEGITLQFYFKQTFRDKSILEAYRARKYSNKILQNINLDSVVFFETSKTKSVKLYCFVTYNANYKKDPINYLPVFFDKPVKEKTEKKIRDALEKLNQFITQFRSLESLGIKINKLISKEIFELCYQYLNPNRSKYILSQFRELESDFESESFYKKHGYLKNFTLRDQLLTSALKNEAEYLYIDQTYIKSINIDLPSSKADASLLKAVLRLIPIDYEFSLSISSPSQLDEMSKLATKRRIIKGSGGLISTGISNAYEEVNSFEEVNQAIEELSKKEQKLFVVSICAIVKDADLYECDKKAQIIETALSNIHHTVAIKDNYNHLSNFFSFLPGQYWLNKRQHSLLTKSVVYTLPLLATFQGTKYSQMIFKKNTEELINFSFINNGLPASHAIVIAPTGKGKSFTMNFLLKNLCLYSENDFITIIDKGGSYQKLCTLFGGDYVQIELNEDFAINPFPEKKLLISGGKIDPDQLVFLRKLIVLLITDTNLKELSSNQEHIIEQAIIGLYGGIESSEAPLLGDFQKFLEKIKPKDDEDGLFLVTMNKNLNLYTASDSSYSMLLNRPSKICFDNRFIVFDRTRLVDHPRLQNIYFFLINNCISLRMTDGLKEGTNQYVVFEEVADLLTDKHTADMLAEKYRTARKYGTILFSVSQGVKDFLNPLAYGILENSSIKIILQLDSEFDKLPALNINENEIETIKSLQSIPGTYSQVFIKFGSESFVLQVEPSRMEYEICATDASSFTKYHSFYGGEAEVLFEEIKHHASKK